MCVYIYIYIYIYIYVHKYIHTHTYRGFTRATRVRAPVAESITHLPNIGPNDTTT